MKYSSIFACAHSEYNTRIFVYVTLFIIKREFKRVSLALYDLFTIFLIFCVNTVVMKHRGRRRSNFIKFNKIRRIYVTTVNSTRLSITLWSIALCLTMINCMFDENFNIEQYTRATGHGTLIWFSNCGQYSTLIKFFRIFNNLFFNIPLLFFHKCIILWWNIFKNFENENFLYRILHLENWNSKILSLFLIFCSFLFFTIVWRKRSSKYKFYMNLVIRTKNEIFLSTQRKKLSFFHENISPRFLSKTLRRVVSQRDASLYFRIIPWSLVSFRLYIPNLY